MLKFNTDRKDNHVNFFNGKCYEFDTIDHIIDTKIYGSLHIEIVRIEITHNEIDNDRYELSGYDSKGNLTYHYNPVSNRNEKNLYDISGNITLHFETDINDYF